MTDASFRDLELQGWNRRAQDYDDWFGRISSQAFPHILDAAGTDLAGKRVLDVCCGPGHLAARLAESGADVEGLDFSPRMVAVARTLHPGLRFVEGDGENLPHAEASLDIVTCAFGLLHFSDPDRAISEAFRVLRPGGRYIATAWQGPEAGNDFFEVLLGSMRDFGTLDLPLPPAPPLLRFGDPDEARRSLESQGFAQVDTRSLPLTWQFGPAEEMIEMIEQGLVRGAMMLEFQTDEARSRIKGAMLERIGRFRTPDGHELRFPALMIDATRPA